MFRGHPQREPDGRELDHPLIGLRHRPPVFWMFWVSAVAEAAPKEFPMFKLATAGGQGHEPPEWPRETFQIRGGTIEMRRSTVEPNARRSWGEVGQ